MATKYNLILADGNSVVVSKKATAIKRGEEAGMAFQVVTVPGGKIVHDGASDVGESVAEPEQEQAPAEEPETADETVEEDLIGDVAVEPEPEQEKAERKFDIRAMRDKIAKLLAKAESTDSEAERDSLNAKAEDLMIRLGIQRAELEAAGEVKPEDIVETVRDWKGNYSIVMVPFVADLAAGYGNITVLQTTHSAMLRRTYIIGHKTDVENFCRLVDSLGLQVLAALHRWQREHAEERRGLTDMQKYVQHRSFISGFGKTCAARLREMRPVVEQEEHISTGASLVLASKQERVDTWITEQYGELKSGRGGMQQFSSGAMYAGAQAGRDANLGEKSVGGSKKEIEK